MRNRLPLWMAPAILVLVAGLAGMAHAAPGPSNDRRATRTVSDTLLVRDLTAPRGPDQTERRPGDTPVARLGLRPYYRVASPDLVQEFMAERRRLPWLRTSDRLALARVGGRAPLPTSADTTVQPTVALPPGTELPAPPAAPALLPAQPLPDSAAPATDGLLPFGEYADLGVRARTRAELGGDWVRFRPCTDQFQEQCQPSLVPQLRPDLNFALQVEGTVLDRINVQVDYDQLREFGGTNTLSVEYLGESDEILQRFAVGDVNFALPRSRFVTQGVPAGNFGFQLEGQLGPMDFRTVWAEQRGNVSSREFRLTGVGQDRRFVQTDTLILDDADYARGQFFFIVRPEDVTDFPHLDILALDAGSAAPQTVPGIEPIQVYRFDNNPAARQQVQGYIQADATASDGFTTVTESGWFRYLIPGQDYFVHPSGLWLALRTPLSRDEMLAVTYINAVGDTIGDYNPEVIYNRGVRPQLQLLKATDANHQPGRPTWDLEMRQVYRISTSPDVEQASVEVTVSLGEISAGRTFKRSPTGQDITFLQLFGLDQESPQDQVDPAYVYNPAAELFQDPPVVSGTFLVFPTLRPFAAPPPVPSLGLTAADAQSLLGDDANDRIYAAEDPFERDNGRLFRLNIPYRVRSEGVISTFSLGSLGVLQGSEQIRLGDRLLIEGVDYQLDYDTGLVTLLDPDALFATVPDATIRAVWEQQQSFRAAPTSVAAFTAHTGDRESGELNFLALYQTEKTLVNRPVLGLEPGSVLMTGLSGEMDRAAPWLDGLLSYVPGLRQGEASSLSMTGELAVSLPTPNLRGSVFLDDFDAAEGRPLSLLAQDWRRGSPPSSREGADAQLPPILGPDEQAQLTWQHTWIIEDAQGDSLDIFQGLLAREDVDRQIRVAGTQVREAALRLTVDVPRDGEQSFSAITTVLAPNGTDLTRSEFIEFYASGLGDAQLIVDLGTVSEDVLFVDDNGLTVGVKESGVPWGVGLLDQEADPSLAQVWGNDLDALGVWGESCQGEPGRVFRLGDPRSICTRSNGLRDTEDLDEDGNLDTAERALRYVLPLDGTSPFVARNRAETGTQFRLYRIPIRGGGVEVNGPVTEADLRAIRHLRLTVVSDQDAELTLSRLRIVGSRWIRRIADGALTGIIGDTVAITGRAEVSPVSRIEEGDAYASPPGVLEQLADPTTAVAGQGVEFNERSLSIQVEDLQPGDRGEVFSRFPQRPRNFLIYREARLWVLPRAGDWSEDGDVRFFLKVGSDPENFYLYRTPLRTATTSPVSPGDWLPEVVVDFEEFIELRARAEATLILDPPQPGGPPIQVWSPDSTYAVVLTDRGRAPDLANVRELALGIWNQSGAPFSGEVWVNELRLARGDDNAGLAGVVQATLNAGDFLTSSVSFSSRDGTFRQLRENPSYQRDQRFALSSRARLDRLLPADWGVEVPVSLTVDRSGLDPQFLFNSDIRAERLPGLREVGNRRTQLSVGFRKVVPSGSPILGVLVNGLEANLTTYSVRNATVTSRVESSGVDARVGYVKRPRARELDPVPGFLEGITRFLLPGGLEEAVLGSRLRLTPQRISFGTAYARRDDDIFRFERIILTEDEAVVIPQIAPRETLEFAGEVALQPLQSLSASVEFRSFRDLLRPEERVADPAVQALLARERARAAGLDLGWETDRTLGTRIRYRPRIWSWLEQEVGWSTRYSSQRNAGFLGLDVVGADSLPILQRNLRAERTATGRVALNPGAVADAIFGADGGGLAAAVLSAFRPLTWSATDGITSRFNRAAVDPGLDYQFGWVDAQGFRVLPGDTAATLTDGLSQRVGWGLGGSRASVEVAWAESSVQALDARADRDIISRTFPDVRARLADVDALSGLAPGLTRVSLSVGWVENSRETRLGTQGDQTRFTEEVQVPWDITLTWVGSVVTSYRGSLLDGEGKDPTGDTERDRVNHRISFTSSFVPPFGIGGPGARPVQVSVIGSYQGERECRVPRARQECVPFVDQLNRALSLTMDTRVRELQLGIQASLTDRRSFIGRRFGSAQFQLGIFGQFVFEAGRFAEAAAGGFSGG